MTGLFDDIPDGDEGGMFGDLPADTSRDGWMKYANGIAQQVANSVTFDYADEIAAGMGSIFSDKSRKELLAEVRKQDKDFKRDYPKTALAANVAGAFVPGAGAAGWIGRGGTWAARALRTAGVTAPMGALSATGRIEGDDKSLGDYAGEAGKGALIGGGLGAGLSTAGSAVGATVGPWATDAARRLMDRGIRLTPGELMGPNAKRFEDLLTAVPLVNRALRNRQAEGLEDFNREALNTTIRDLNAGITTQRLRSAVTELPPHLRSGHEAVEFVGDTISDAYRAAIPNLRAHVDSGVRSVFAHIRNTLPRDRWDAFDDAIQRNVTDAADRAGRLTGRGVQHSLGALRDEARGLITSQASTHYDRLLGQALNRARDVLRNNTRMHSGTQAFRKFSNVEEAFARLVRTEGAASSVAAEGGVFTPAMLHRSVRAADRSARKRGVARGAALMQDLSDDAKSVMSRRINDSGTPERAAMAGLLGGVGYMAGLKSLIAPALLGGMYSRQGNAIIRQMAAGSPQTRAMLRRIIEQVTAGGAPGAVMGMTGSE